MEKAKKKKHPAGKRGGGTEAPRSWTQETGNGNSGAGSIFIKREVLGI